MGVDDLACVVSVFFFFEWERPLFVGCWLLTYCIGWDGMGFLGLLIMHAEYVMRPMFDFVDTVKWFWDH